MTLEQITAGQTEWRHWQDVCNQLRALNAVTDEDLKASPRAHDTPGQVLLATIRNWGESLPEVRRLNQKINN